MDIGKTIRNRRRALKLTQTELAECAKTTTSIISRLENNKYNAGIALLERVARVLRGEITMQHEEVETEK